MRVFFRLAAGNLFKNLRRSLSTGSTIAMGLAGLILLGGYLLRMERYLATQSVYLSLNGHIIAYAKGGLDRHLSTPSQFSFSELEWRELYAFASEDQRVVHSAPLIRGLGMASNGCASQPFVAMGAPLETMKWSRSQLNVERFVPELAKVSFGKGFWNEGAGGLNLSHRIITLLGKEQSVLHPIVSETVGEPNCDKHSASGSKDPTLQLLATTFDGGLGLAEGPVVGSVSTGLAFMDDTAALFSLEMAQRLFGTENATSFVFFLKDERQIPQVLTELKAKFGAWADFFPFYHPEISAFYVGGMEFNWVMFYLFLFLVCSVVGISISNSLYITLMERRDELGTLRSIGFKRRQVVKLLLLENGILGFISILVGVGLALLVSILVNHQNIPMVIPGLSGAIQFRLHLTPLFSVAVAIVLWLLVLSATWIGARRFINKSILALWKGR